MGLRQIDETIQRLSEKRSQTLDLLIKGGYDVSEFDEDYSETPQSAAFSLKAEKLKKLRVACIMDIFSRNCFAPECTLLELTPENWKAELKEFNADILIVESAWEGKDKLWYEKIVKCSKEYFDLTEYCRKYAIPVVFWNKEDPVYTDSFMAAARQADFVFTTDIDCISRYKSELGHDRVYHLHFAAQPTLHNPIEKYERKARFCFAGAYYHRYRDRAIVFDRFADVFEKSGGLDIYDRNYGHARPEHAFPNRYNKNILGSLAPEDINVAYKSYIYGVNMNSIQQSQTMFARRAFELLASNTVTVGNYSRGLRNYFGDLTICTDDENTLDSYIKKYCSDDLTLAKYRLAGLRQALMEHLYEDRLNYIVQKVYGKSLKPPLPSITVFCEVDSLADIERMRLMLQKQTYHNFETVYISDLSDIDMIRFISKEKAKCTPIHEITKTDFIAVMSPRDYYGKNYLLDLVLTTRYGKFKAIGKAAYFASSADDTLDIDLSPCYRPAKEFSAKRSIAMLDLAFDRNVAWLLDCVWDSENMLCVDPFNYCENHSGVCDITDDIDIPNIGIPISLIYNVAENITGDLYPFGSLVVDVSDIFDPASIRCPYGLSVTKNGSSIYIDSELASDAHSYVYSRKAYQISELTLINGQLRFKMQGTGNADLSCALIFFDASSAKLTPAFSRLNTLSSVMIPDGAVRFELALRFKGTGSVNVQRLIIGGQDIDDSSSCSHITRSDVLVLTNQYPEKGNLYRNMFVHRRVMGYKEDGLLCDVMRMNIYAKDGYYEFEGIDVVDGQTQALRRILDSGVIKTVCAHFLDITMWSVLKEYLGKIRLIVWLHGAEVQPWWRRTFNFTSDAELEKSKISTEELLRFWAEVFKHADSEAIHFVFISQYFADEVMEDNNIVLPESSYSIIHNFIDTELFKYRPKEANQRKKILSIKPYASRKYANDLTTKAIVELSKNPVFDELEFYIYGDGEMFESDTAPLKRYKNVYLHHKFLSQREIADLHEKCGVYIATTRMDAQGVSRDEAMSSGLVPIANAVAAIPEFVDEECGILVPAEDYIGVAQAIISLYNDPDVFLKLSKAAAIRVRKQSSRVQTIEKEKRLIILILRNDTL